MGSPPPSTPSDSPPPSWSLLDFTYPLSYLPQEELQHPPFSLGSQNMAPSPAFNNNSNKNYGPPPPLSSQAAMATSTTKVSKRKSRAVSKPPIRVLSADRANFRDMVQRLTGIPSSPPMQATSRLLGSGMSPAIFRPMPARPFPLTSQPAIAPNQSMPITLDTSSGYLSRGVRQNNPMNGTRFHGNYDANYDAIAVASKALLGGESGGGGPYNEGSKHLHDLVAVQALESLRPVSDLESLLLGAHKLDDHFSTSWLSSDIVHMPAPAVEVAHSA